MINRTLLILFVIPFILNVSYSEEKSDTSISMKDSGFLLKSEIDIGGVNSSGVILSIGGDLFGSNTSFSVSYSFFLEQTTSSKKNNYASIFKVNYGLFTYNWSWAKVGLSYSIGTKYYFDYEINENDYLKSNYTKFAITLDVGHSWQFSRITRVGWNLSIGVGKDYMLLGLGVIFQLNNPF